MQFFNKKVLVSRKILVTRKYLITSQFPFLSGVGKIESVPNVLKSSKNAT